MTPIAPGATIGIIGGGQLGRMLAVAAARFGYRAHVFAPEIDSVAAEVAARFTRANYDDAEALARFAAQIDIATYEFENLPVAPLDRLAELVRLRPGTRSLAITQDRLAERRFLGDLGIAVAPWSEVGSLDDLQTGLENIGARAVLKTRRFGYDGKGQARLTEPGDAPRAWIDIGERPAIVEALVDFSAEFSIIVCRAASGDTICWEAAENVHDHGVLATSTVPASPRVDALSEAARAIALRIAEALDHVGVLTVEFFATDQGPIVNEIAPRVHNSGHWTIEGASTSQFENHVRAVCGLPLGSTERRGARVHMRNLIGEQANGWRALLAEPGAHLHLYGKGEPRPRRKMGHVTTID